MVYAIRYIGTTGLVINSATQPAEGAYLEHYDPERFDGQGLAIWTTDPAKAWRFESPGDAIRTWKAVPVCRPWRPDGKPNRPLTAFTIEVAKIVDPSP